MGKRTKKVISVTISEELHGFMKDQLRDNKSLSSWISDQIHEFSSSVALEKRLGPKMTQEEIDDILELGERITAQENAWSERYKKLETEQDRQREKFREDFLAQTNSLPKESVDEAFELAKQYELTDEGYPIDPTILKAGADIFTRLESEKKRLKREYKRKQIMNVAESLVAELMTILKDNDD